MNNQSNGDLLRQIQLQLSGYTGSNSRFNRFFSGMWGRNHIPAVERIVNKLNNNELSLTQLFSELRSIHLVNKNGSLSRIIRNSLTQLIDSPDVEWNKDLLSDAFCIAIKYDPDKVRPLLAKVSAIEKGDARNDFLFNALYYSISYQPSALYPILSMIDQLPTKQRSAIFMRKIQPQNSTFVDLVVQRIGYFNDKQIDRIFNSLDKLSMIEKRALLVENSPGILVAAVRFNNKPKLIERMLQLIQGLNKAAQKVIFEHRDWDGDLFSIMRYSRYRNYTQISGMINEAYKQLNISLASESIVQPVASHSQLIEQLSTLTGLSGWKLQLQQGTNTLKLSIKSDEADLIKKSTDALATCNVQCVSTRSSNGYSGLSLKIEDVDLFLQAIQSKLPLSSPTDSSMEVRPPM